MVAARHPDQAEPDGRRARSAAIVEVVLAFVAVHVAYRALKQFTSLGRLESANHLNFTPGCVMILSTILILALGRRDFASYGLTLAGWRDGLKQGLLWGLVLVAGGILLRVSGVQHLPGTKPPTLTEGLVYGFASLLSVVLFVGALRRQRLILTRIPATVCLWLLLGLLAAPLVIAWCFSRPMGHTFLTVLWLVIGAGCGEEIFYRGYLQSRLNESFGRPFRLFGVQFGLGLLVTSLLFGFLHALNTVDYFHGRFTFAWGYGLATICIGLLYGCLRESTGSVLAGAITHSLLDVLVQIPGLISGP